MIGAVLGRGRRSTGWCLGGATGLVAASLLSVIVAGSGVAWAAPRDFDPSFGSAGTGIVQYATGTGAAANGVAVVPPGLGTAGDIVVSTDGGSASQFEVARFTPSGGIDTTFATAGTGLVDAFSGEANAVAVVPSGITGAGDIVAVGEQPTSSTTCASQQPVVVVYTQAGTLLSTTPVPCPTGGFFDGFLNAVTIDASGNIVAAGQAFSPNATLETRVARLTPGGTVTSSAAAAIGTNNSAAMGVGVSPTSGGDIYTTGYSYRNVGSPPTATRFLTVAAFNSTTGALDSDFGTSGVVTSPDAPNSIGNAITVLPNGHLVAAGSFSSSTTAPNQSFLAQFTAAGVPATGFGTSGEVKNNPSLGATSEYHAVAYQPEGSVLVAAGSVLSGSSQEMIVAQYDSTTGLPNQLFGTGGALAIPIPPGPSSLAAVAVQPDGKAVGAGLAPTVNASPDIGLVRVQVPAPHPYAPITPTRVCDTRSGNPSGLTGPATQCNGHTIAANSSVTVQVAGLFSVPTDATAVVVNVTAVNPAGPGFLTVYPPGSLPPAASNLNVTAGQVVANLAEVALSGGAISVFSSVSSDVVVDVEGYTAPTVGSPGTGLYNTLASPTRVCDTRIGNPSGLSGLAAQCNSGTIPPGGTQKIQIAGNFGVPGNATAVVANLTVVNPNNPGFVTAFPDGSAVPTASNVDYGAGQVIPNRVIVPLGPDGMMGVFSPTRTDVLLDVSGYYTAPGGSGSAFAAENTPVRVCDTRTGNPSGLSGEAAQCNNNPLQPGHQTLTVQVAGNFAVPAAAKAVVVNVTAVNPNSMTFLTVYSGGTVPNASDLNPPVGGIEPNLVVATLSPTGSISIANLAGTVDVVVDVSGWYQ